MTEFPSLRSPVSGDQVECIGVWRRHLQKYVDEFCYRYNLRDAAPWEAFDRTIDRGLRI